MMHHNQIREAQTVSSAAGALLDRDQPAPAAAATAAGMGSGTGCVPPSQAQPSDCWTIDMAGFSDWFSADTSTSSYMQPRSSEPGQHSDVAAVAAILGSDARRRRRLSEHGCGCRSFTYDARSAAQIETSSHMAGSTKPVWRGDVARPASSRGADRSPAARASGQPQQPFSSDVAAQPKTANSSAAADDEVAVQLQGLQSGTGSPGADAAASPPAPSKAAAGSDCTAAGRAEAHRQLSVLLDDEDGGLPLAAFAIMSVAPRMPGV